MNRSKWKGLFIDNKIIKSLHKKVVYIYSRRSVIYPQFINRTVNIYNGHKFIKVKVTSNMIGHKFGEFASTRQPNIFKKSKNIKK